MVHIPVLLNEVLRYVNPGPDQNFIDATFGFGGHSAAILERNGPSGKVLGIEADSELYTKLVDKKNVRLVLVNDSYANLGKIVADNKFRPVHGILADLGMSSWHLDQSERGFSFLKDEPLLMAYSKSQIANGQTAAEIVNSWGEDELANIFFNYGEEKFSRQIAHKIIEYRKATPIVKTFQLVEIIKNVTPDWYHHQRVNPATKTFQALRITVNDELENLKMFLPQALSAMESGGRLAVISFHSLEDRIVKIFFKEKRQNGEVEILTKKPIVPSQKEINANPRSRSAKLRAVIKL